MAARRGRRNLYGRRRNPRAAAARRRSPSKAAAVVRRRSPARAEAPRSYAAPVLPAISIGGKPVEKGWGKWLALGGVAALGYVMYSKFKQAAAAAQFAPARAKVTSAQMFAPTDGQALSLQPLLQQRQSGVLPLSTTPTPILKPGVTVAETKPGVIQMVTAAGKKKKLTAKQIEDMLPAQVYVRDRWIATPNDKGKKGMEKLDAQQDLCDLGAIRGWLTQVGTAKTGAPQYSVLGQKKKMARAAAAKYVKAKLVMESLSAQTATQTQEPLAYA